MALVGVVADDLTGANDTAVQFSKQGLRAVVLLDSSNLAQQNPDPDVLVIDTASRSLSPAEAAASVTTAVEALAQRGVSLLYKKLDSTLRGNIAAEIVAALDAFGGQACLVAPAFPALSRVTVGGYQLAGQMLTAESRDGPLRAAEHAHLPTLLSSVASSSVGHLAILDIRQSADRLEQKIRGLVNDGHRLLISDALNDHDLLHVARAFRAANVGNVLAGSGGLASVVPSVWGLRRRPAGSTAAVSPVLVLAGSLNRVTRRQLAVLASLPKAPEFVQLSISRLDNPETRKQEWERVVAELLIKLLCGNDVVMSSVDPESLGPESPPADDRGQALRAVINATFGMLARRSAEAEPTVGLVVTGGDVAEAVLRELDAAGLAIEDEVQPGIPFGRCVAGPFEGLRIISKAGGFGGDTALADAMRYLKEEARHHERQRT